MICLTESRQVTRPEARLLAGTLSITLFPVHYVVDRETRETSVSLIRVTADAVAKHQPLETFLDAEERVSLIK